MTPSETMVKRNVTATGAPVTGVKASPRSKTQLKSWIEGTRAENLAIFSFLSTTWSKPGSCEAAPATIATWVRLVLLICPNG